VVNNNTAIAAAISIFFIALSPCDKVVIVMWRQYIKSLILLQLVLAIP
jgi:hypothetical protein